MPPKTRKSSASTPEAQQVPAPQEKANQECVPSTTGLTMVPNNENASRKSAYELARDARLRENRLRMLELGLDKAVQEANAAVGSMIKPETDTKSKVRVRSAKKLKRVRKGSLRLSKRARGLGPDGKAVDRSESDDTEDKEKLDKLKKLVNLYGQW